MDEQQQVSGSDSTKKGEIAKMDVKQLITKISNKNFLMNFLRQHNIADVEQLQVVDHYVQGKHRAGIIIEVFERNRNGKTKILIDLKLGQPVIEQVHDALYTTGQDCEIKIIVYCDQIDNNDGAVPSADAWAVSCLISALQESGIRIGLFEMIRDYMIIPSVDFQTNFSQTVPPTLEQFWAETFWAVYFDSFNESFYRDHPVFEDGFIDMSDCGFLIYIDERPMYGEIELYFDESGTRFEVKELQYPISAATKIDELINDLKKQYGESNIIINQDSSNSPTITIRHSSKPFSWIYDASPDEITDFAQKIHKDAWGLRSRFDEILENL